MTIHQKRSFLFTILLAGLLIGCGSSQSTSNSEESADHSQSVTNPSFSLADYLRRIPGLNVMGSGDNASVTVRGAQSISGNNQPLFVVNGSRVGNSLSQVSNFIEVSDIESVEVLKGNQASTQYGLAGSGGVVVIRTKKK